ncbi:MAG TPA: hypothetical protein VNT58_07045 [Gaiellaceae bacterium]|nr:hypothetical protein [Gaiellaceae bacterium]
MIEQTIWLSPRTIAFTAVCAVCASERGFGGAQVAGRLPLERGRGTARCVGGHELRVERVHPEPIGARDAA